LREREFELKRESVSKCLQVKQVTKPAEGRGGWGFYSLQKEYARWGVRDPNMFGLGPDMSIKAY
jgi:hypothetical protein